MLEPDQFENNDTQASATVLGSGDQSYQGLTIDAPSDDDWYRWTAAGNGTLTVDVLFTHAVNNDVDLSVHDSAGVFIASSTSVDDNERVVINVTAGSSYLIRVYGFSGDVHHDYDLSIDGPNIISDQFENNDTQASATVLGSGDQSHQGLTIDAPSDDDWYRWTAASNGTLTVDVLFTHAVNNDVDLSVHDSAGVFIASSTSVDDNERVVINVTAGSSYLIRVYGFSGSVHHDYDLILDGPSLVTELIVDQFLDESDANTSAGDLSLREAIGIASSNPSITTIRFAANLNGQTIRLVRGELAIARSLTIDASALNNGLTIDASGNDLTPTVDDGGGTRIFNIDDNSASTFRDVTIRGLRLTGGDVTGVGGAIRSTENLSLVQSNITGNSSATATDNSVRGDGGGIWANGMTAIVDSMISGNSAILIPQFLGSRFGEVGRGGGLWLGGVTTIADSQVSNNSTADGSDSDTFHNHGGSGGGIYATSALTIADSTISGNIAGDGGKGYNSTAGGDGGAGGGIIAAYSLNITNSTIVNNRAGDGGFNRASSSSARGGDGGAGGGVFAQGVVSLVDTTVSGNRAGSGGGTHLGDGHGGSAGNGGGVYSAFNVFMTRSHIENNHAGHAGTGRTFAVEGGSGGGVWAGGFDITESIIKNNTAGGGAHYGGGAGGSGGGIFAVNGGEIANTTITGNRAGHGGYAEGYDALGGAGGKGGGIYSQSYGLIISGSTISENVAGSGGNGSDDDKAHGGDGGGGGGIAAMGPTSISSSVISGNSAGEGGFSSDGQEYYVRGGSGGSGGGILALGASTTISNTTISGNRTGPGGGNFGPDFTTNSVGPSGDGGGVSGNNLTIISSQIVDNRTASGTNSSGGYAGDAGRGGGVFGQTARIVDSEIERNSTGIGGSGKGGIVGYSGDGGDGGGVYATTLTVENSLVDANFTTGVSAEGGGIFATALTVRTSTISNNYTAGDFSDGGGIVARSATIEFSTVSGNHTRGTRSDGGGVVALSTPVPGTVTFIGSTVSGNYTLGEFARAGGIFSNVSNLSLNGCTITANRTTSSGAVAADVGGIWVYGGSLTLLGSIVAGNTAGGQNPDIRLSATFTIQYCLIGNNSGTSLIASQTPDSNGNLIGGATAGGAINPLLGPLANNGGPTFTHALIPGSPAIDAGDPTAVAGIGGIPVFDQRGTPFGRVEDGDGDSINRIDIGSFEKSEQAGVSADLSIDLIASKYDFRVLPSVEPIADQSTAISDIDVIGFSVNSVGRNNTAVWKPKNTFTRSNQIGSAQNQEVFKGDLRDTASPIRSPLSKAMIDPNPPPSEAPRHPIADRTFSNLQTSRRNLDTIVTQHVVDAKRRSAPPERIDTPQSRSFAAERIEYVDTALLTISESRQAAYDDAHCLDTAFVRDTINRDSTYDENGFDAADAAFDAMFVELTPWQREV